jgi:hypothetical protein
LRKATARRLAEIGCSANQITITGHAVTKLLVPLTLRTDVPQDARDAIAAAIQGTPLSTDVWI